MGVVTPTLYSVSFVWWPARTPRLRPPNSCSPSALDGHGKQAQLLRRAHAAAAIAWPGVQRRHVREREASSSVRRGAASQWDGRRVQNQGVGRTPQGHELSRTFGRRVAIGFEPIESSRRGREHSTSSAARTGLRERVRGSRECEGARTVRGPKEARRAFALDERKRALHHAAVVPPARQCAADSGVPQRSG